MFSLECNVKVNIIRLFKGQTKRTNATALGDLNMAVATVGAYAFEFE
jgi:hypothetical protein